MDSPTPNQPSPEDLIAFACGELDAPRQAEIRAVLDAWPETAAFVRRVEQVVQSLRDLYAPAGAPPGLIERAARLFGAHAPLPDSFQTGADAVVAHLIGDSREHDVIPGFRGSASAYQLTFESDAAEVHLHISEDPSAPSRLVVRGQIDPLQGAEPRSIRFQRVGAQDAPGEATPDQDGHFTVTLAPGTYDAYIRLGEAVMLIPAIEIG